MTDHIDDERLHAWLQEKQQMQEEFRDLCSKLNRARDSRDRAIERMQKAIHDGKSAVKGLDRYKIDGGRYQWLRLIGLRFPGSGEMYAHGYNADRVVDQYMKMEAYGPTMTERRVDPGVRPQRRERDPLNPVLPEHIIERMVALKVRGS